MRSMKATLFFCSLLCLSSVLHAETLAIVGDHNAKPKNWLDKNGQARGIMIDLLEEVSKRTDIRFTYRLMPWKRAFEVSALGKASIIGLSKTTKRQKTWDYSTAMYDDPLVLVTTKNRAFKFEGYESLRNKSIGTKLGTSYGDDFEQARTQGLFKIVETPNRAGQLRMLTLDRIDAVLLSPGRIALEATLSETKWLREHKDEFVVLEPPLKLDPNYLGIPKSLGKSATLKRINSALEAIKADGTHAAIVRKNIDTVLEQLRAMP